MGYEKHWKNITKCTKNSTYKVGNITYTKEEFIEASNTVRGAFILGIIIGALIVWIF